MANALEDLTKTTKFLYNCSVLSSGLCASGRPLTRTMISERQLEFNQKAMVPGAFKGEAESPCRRKGRQQTSLSSFSTYQLESSRIYSAEKKHRYACRHRRKDCLSVATQVTEFYTFMTHARL